MKNLLKEMVYFGLETAVAAKHKPQELSERLINQHNSILHRLDTTAIIRMEVLFLKPESVLLKHLFTAG